MQEARAVFAWAQAKNYGAEAERYGGMLSSPGTAPKPKITSPGAERSAAEVTAPGVTVGNSADTTPTGSTTTSVGTYADREALELQIEQKRSEMQAYYDASGGKADPQVMIWYANQIHDTMQALDTLPTEPVREDVLLQTLGGSYYQGDVSLGGAGAQVALGTLGLDLPADIRDISYDIRNWKSVPGWQKAADFAALLPLVGGLKYVDEAAEGTKALRRAAEAAGKHGDELVDAGKAVAHLAENGTAVAEGAKLTDRLMEAGQTAGRKVDFTGLDQKTIDEYTEIIQRYDEAANAQETITYFRVQGGVKDTAAGLNRSQLRISITEDGKIAIPKKNTQLSISAYTTQHAEYYKGTRGQGTEVIAFDVPKYLDELMRENAVLAENYRSLPWNQGGTAPKIPDVNQPGFPYNVSQPWLDWLEEYAYNARNIDLGGKK